MSYAKNFYVDRAIQDCNFPPDNNGRIANLLIPFAAYSAKKNGLDISSTVGQALAGDDIPAAIKAFLSGDGAKWAGRSLSTFEKVSLEEIKDYILDKISTWNNLAGHDWLVVGMPSSLNDLVASVLDIRPDDSVIDLGSGLGSFVIHIAKNYSYKTLEGIEINNQNVLYSSMLAYLEDVHPVIKLGNVLELDGRIQFSKILTFPELASRIEIPFIKKTLELLSDGGRALVFLGQGFLFAEGHGYKDARKNLIDGGFVEAVIELPAGVLYPYTGISTCLVVLSKGNKTLRLVDASDFYENTRRGASSLTAENSKSIFEMINRDSDKSRIIDYNEIKFNDYALTSCTYFLEEKISFAGVQNYEKLSNLVESKILRGAQIKASELEELSSDEDTECYYAFAKDIKENRLGSDLKALKQIDSKFEGIVLKDEDILLVMAMTENLKVACVENLKGKKIIPASNIYIIRLDQKKILPVYFKMLLETKQALQIFEAFCGGTVLKAISVEFLNKLKIPLPPLEEQTELVKKYRNIEDESEKLKQQLAALEQEKGEVLASLF